METNEAYWETVTKFAAGCHANVAIETKGCKTISKGGYRRLGDILSTSIEILRGNGLHHKNYSSEGDVISRCKNGARMCQGHPYTPYQRDGKSPTEPWKNRAIFLADCLAATAEHYGGTKSIPKSKKESVARACLQLAAMLEGNWPPEVDKSRLETQMVLEACQAAHTITCNRYQKSPSNQEKLAGKGRANQK